MNKARNRAQRRLIHSAAAGVLGVALFAAAGTAFALSESARDEFSSISYSGNNGTLAWAGSWNELGESDGPSAGVIDVSASNRCVANNCLRIGGDAADVNGRGVWREVNLANVSAAELTFSYRRDRTGQASTSDSAVGVAVSDNAGETWTTLGTFDFGGPEAVVVQSFDITFYASSETRIRFLATGASVTGYLTFDDIEIGATFSELPTTTTPSSTSTTTPSSTSTTTPSSTSTTTPSSISTTTPRSTTTTTPRSTTTTTPRSTTTTTPRSTTTTTAPGAVTNASTPPSDSDQAGGDLGHLSPIKGLTVTFRSTVEAIGESAFSIVALGILVGWLSILGLDRRGGTQPARRRL